MAEWETVKIPEDMVKKIDRFTKSQNAKDLGYTSRSQAVIAALRDFLLKWKPDVTFYLKSPKYGKIKFKKIGPLIQCQKCKSQVCDHAILLFRHKRSFDMDLTEEGDILSGVDLDKIPDIKNPQPT